MVWGAFQQIWLKIMTNIHGNNKLVIVDSDALIGLISENDLLHRRCMSVLDYIASYGLTTIVCQSTILEASTTLSRVINRADLAQRLLRDFALLKQPEFSEIGAMSFMANTYNLKVSKKNTPFDYYVLAVAKINNINLVFSFDTFYKKQGLTLIESQM